MQWCRTRCISISFFSFFIKNAAATAARSMFHSALECVRDLRSFNLLMQRATHTTSLQSVSESGRQLLKLQQLTAAMSRECAEYDGRHRRKPADNAPVVSSKMSYRRSTGLHSIHYTERSADPLQRRNRVRRKPTAT